MHYAINLVIIVLSEIGDAHPQYRFGIQNTRISLHNKSEWHTWLWLFGYAMHCSPIAPTHVKQPVPFELNPHVLDYELVKCFTYDFRQPTPLIGAVRPFAPVLSASFVSEPRVWRGYCPCIPP